MSIRIGDVCTVVRFFPHSDAVDHQWEDGVTKVTKARAYVGNRHWFSLADPDRKLLPKYLDYRTRVTDVRATPAPSADGENK